MLTKLEYLARRWVAVSPFTNVYGVARSLLAIGTAATLAWTSIEDLFTNDIGLPAYPQCVFGAAKLSLFCLTPAEGLEPVRWLCIATLLFIASGWWPRYTGLVHWWISFSLAASVPISVLQGGDMVAAVLTLLLVPVTLLDPRANHWSSVDTRTRQKNRPRTPQEGWTRLVARSCFFVIRLQVAGIYAHSALAKFAVREWIDGTVLYYWFFQPIFPTPDWAKALVLNGPIGAVMTWGALVIELCLVLALLAPRRGRSALLILGVIFHGAIAVVFGLVTFGIAMIAALILLTRMPEEQFGMPRIGLVRGLREQRPKPRVAGRAAASS